MDPTLSVSDGTRKHRLQASSSQQEPEYLREDPTSDDAARQGKSEHPACFLRRKIRLFAKHVICFSFSLCLSEGEIE